MISKSLGCVSEHLATGSMKAEERGIGCGWGGVEKVAAGRGGGGPEQPGLGSGAALQRLCVGWTGRPCCSCPPC